MTGVKQPTDHINLAHGAGGKAMRELVENEILAAFNNPVLASLEDQARIPLSELTALGSELAFTTDSFVVDPIEFPGSDIGELAVNGTVNDLAMSGAKPLYLTCGLIIEEGFPVILLRKLLNSMRTAADKAGVSIVSGDTKVVHKGAADKLFINTSGVGVIPTGLNIKSANAKVGDKIIINGLIGDHGAAVLQARGDLALDVAINSDCQSLYSQVKAMLDVSANIHCLRDATRGGVATVLNEFAEASDTSLLIDEQRLPVREEVKGMCEILGLEPLYLANEGKFVAIVPQSEADAVLAALKQHPDGKDAAIIGQVVEKQAAKVMVNTLFGSQRMLDTLVGDQLPRIC